MQLLILSIYNLFIINSNMNEHDDPSVSSSSFSIPNLEVFGGNSQRSVSYSSFDFSMLY